MQIKSTETSDYSSEKLYVSLSGWIHLIQCFSGKYCFQFSGVYIDSKENVIFKM